MSHTGGTSYRTVLVGTDGSDSSLRAVDRAAVIARDAGATLLLACAFRPLPERQVREAGAALGDEQFTVAGSSPAEIVLLEATDRAAALGATDVQRHALAGDAVDGLLDLAVDRRVDLVVVGNRGLNSLAGRVLGSVPAAISHRARCDVLIVHTTGRGATSPA